MSTTPPPSRNQQKRTLLERFLEEDYAFIHIKVKTPGLVLPLNVMQEQMTTLKVSFNFQGAMKLSDEGIVAELSFGNRTFSCKIPWEAIWAMTSIKDERLMWTDELPAEVLKSLSQAPAEPTPTSSTPDSELQPTESPTKAKPALAPSPAVTPEGGEEAPTQRQSPQKPSPTRPQLKRIK